MAERIGVSVSSIKHNLGSVRELLGEHGVTLVSVPQKGMYVEATEEQRTELENVLLWFSNHNPVSEGFRRDYIFQTVFRYQGNYTVQLLAEEKIKDGDLINVVVPTGNFGNILAAFYAKNMGLPIGKLICASNDNKVLYDFFDTGVYDRNREFVLTSSPSMDILISSNLERLIYKIAGNDSDKNAQFMKALVGVGKYEISQDMKDQLADFYGNYASEQETAEVIKGLYEDTGYVIDTHTAVAASVYQKYMAETKDNKPTIIVSTASPFKFTRSVMNAIDKKYDEKSDFELVDELSVLANVAIPEAIEEIRTAPIVHDHICEINEMSKTVETFLKLR